MDIGIKIKALRLQCGLTQEELADRCELSKGYISQLENDLTSPSITTLVDILNALGTSPRDFFADEEEEKAVFAQTDFFEKVTEENTITWLVPNSQKNLMEPIALTLNPFSKTTEDMPHEGEEFGWVLEGSVRLHLGKRSYPVEEGSSFYYRCDKIHYLENVTKKQAKLIWVSTPPTF